MKIVINRSFSSFALSDKALAQYKDLSGSADIDSWEIKRNDPFLVQVIEELGDEASGFLANLKIVEIPDGIDWEIADDDGMESIEERHRSWS